MAQRVFRGSGWASVAGGLVLVVGALAGAAAVVADAAPTGPRAIRVHLSYGCRFPSGPRQAGVTVTATFPAGAVVGRPIQPTGLRLAVALPPSAVADLAGLGAAQVSGSDVLTAALAHGPNAVTKAWQVQVPRAVPIPAAGSVLLSASGAVPPVTASASGTLTVTALGLRLALDLNTASGTPANPATLRVACTLSPGQNARLAVIRVTGTSLSPAASAARAGDGKPPPGCGAIHVKSPQIACGYITGYANVNKLNGSALLQPPKPQKPGLVNIAENIRTKQIPGGVILYNTGQLYYRGHEELPPVRTTFLGFGFTPITVTLEITELKPINIEVVLISPRVEVIATTKVSFRLFDATVNGVRWDNLGSRCRTKTPITLRLIGEGSTDNGGSGFFDLAAGGTLGGFVNVPPFIDCGIGENLDPLFTASISGPANFDLMTQGALCFVRPSFPSTCPPPVPKPQRHLIT